MRNCRAVWRAVSSEPCATIVRLTRMTGLATGTVSTALHALRERGYIAYDDNAKKARTVLVPLMDTKRKR